MLQPNRLLGGAATFVLCARDIFVTWWLWDLCPKPHPCYEIKKKVNFPWGSNLYKSVKGGGVHEMREPIQIFTGTDVWLWILCARTTFTTTTTWWREFVADLVVVVRQCNLVVRALFVGSRGLFGVILALRLIQWRRTSLKIRGSICILARTGYAWPATNHWRGRAIIRYLGTGVVMAVTWRLLLGASLTSDWSPGPCRLVRWARLFLYLIFCHNLIRSK